MSKLRLTLAVADYDRTKAIFSGRAQIEGVRPRAAGGRRRRSASTARSSSRSSTSPSCRCRSHMATVSRGENEYVGIPAFVSRVFRHSGIYIRTDRGIKHAAGPARQDHRRARIPDHRQRLDPRHAAGRLRREARGASSGAAAASRSRAATSARRSSCRRTSTCSRCPTARPSPACWRRARSTAYRRARAVLLRPRGAPNVGRLFPDYQEGRAGLLQAHRHLPDHAPDRHPQVAGRAVSVAAGQRLQRVPAGEGRSPCTSSNEIGHLFVNLPWVVDHYNETRAADGRGLLALRLRGEPQCARDVHPLSPRAGSLGARVAPEELFAPRRWTCRRSEPGAMKAPSVRIPRAARPAAGARAARRACEDARVLAGGQSLMPMLNMRVALAGPPGRPQPDRRARQASAREGGAIAFGAMTRQRDIEFSPLVARSCR